MARGGLSRNFRNAVLSLANLTRPQCERAVQIPPTAPHQTIAKCLTTSARRCANVEEITPGRQEPFKAAAPIDFEAKERSGRPGQAVLKTLRVVPASPSYFSAKPTFTDNFINLVFLLKKYATLPTVTPSEAPRVAWKTIDQYRILTNEPVKTLRYHRILIILRRLNCIHPQLMPPEVLDAMKRYKKDVQPDDYKPRPGVIDELGRAKGVGRRKTSSAVAWLVDGEGEVLINGRTLSQFFGRLHDRESAVWALKSTQRLDKYNVFGLVTGGGVTGQAEALTLAVAKALLVHEPGLKPALRRAGCVTRDPRNVERKKPGHVKARKMPTWVKR